MGGAHRADLDGVVRVDRARARRLRAVLGLALVSTVGVGGWMVLQPARPAPDEVLQGREALSTEARVPRPMPPSRALPVPDPMERAMLKAVAQAAHADGGSSPDGELQEVTVDQLGPGDGTGINAFPRPGTKPLKGGLIVPEGYALPPGYVRHYQVTDDGRQLPPILMFHPDYPPRDASGSPIAVPSDRVVPPELAPAGMPQQWLEPPPVREKPGAQ
jgi:hypothetical protein